MKSTDSTDNNVIPFKIKYVFVAGFCDNCELGWVEWLRELDFKKHLVDKRGLCCYCGASGVHYCRPC